MPVPRSVTSIEAVSDFPLPESANEPVFQLAGRVSVSNETVLESELAAGSALFVTVKYAV